MTSLVFTFINTIDPDEQWIVSVRKDNKELTPCDHVVENVTDNVSEMTLLSNVVDYEISHGVVDSQFYHWPFEDSISGEWLDVIDSNTSRHGLGQKYTDQEGNFKIFDQHKTSQASGLLVTAPGKTKEHNHKKSFNRTTHILAKSKLNSLGDEMVATTYSYGETLMPTIQ